MHFTFEARDESIDRSDQGGEPLLEATGGMQRVQSMLHWVIIVLARCLGGNSAEKRFSERTEIRIG